MAETGFLKAIEIFGSIAAPAGIAIGAFLYIARDTIAKNIFPQLSRPMAFALILRLAYMAWSIALAGIGAWTYVSVVTHDPRRDTPNSPAPSPAPVATASSAQSPRVPRQELPENGGWIFAGHFNRVGNDPRDDPPLILRLEGDRPKSIPGDKFRENDKILLQVARPVYILNYRLTGNTEWKKSPGSKETAAPLTADDRTGVEVQKETVLVIRQVDLRYQDQNRSGLWLRVQYPPT